jgi:hypothetical protein
VLYASLPDKIFPNVLFDLLSLHNAKKSMLSNKVNHQLYFSYLKKTKLSKTWRQPRGPLVTEWIDCDTSTQWDIIQH